MKLPRVADVCYSSVCCWGVVSGGDLRHYQGACFLSSRARLGRVKSQKGGVVAGSVSSVP